MITLDLRHAIAGVIADAGFADTGFADASAGGESPAHTRAVDPGLRPGGRPGEYASSVAFALAGTESPPSRIADLLAARLNGRYDWIATAMATGRGYLTITITPEALAALPRRVTSAGPDCARGDALAGQLFPAPEAASWASAPTWEEARARVAAQVTSRLAEAAGASASGRAAAQSRTGTGDRSEKKGEKGADVAAAVAFAGTDAVLFSLAKAMPGRPVRIDPGKIARHHLDNPAYAVRYAHARAASGMRWAAALGTGEAGPQRPPAYPEELTLLDALSWLPERVAAAARRGRPDEFARFTERVAVLALAAVTIPTIGRAPGSDRLAIAGAARAGLAASLGLLGVSAPERL